MVVFPTPYDSFSYSLWQKICSYRVEITRLATEFAKKSGNLARILK